MTQKDIIEVSDMDEHRKGSATVFRNGVEISNHPSFDEAMSAAFPGYVPWDGGRFSCEAQADNRYEDCGG